MKILIPLSFILLMGGCRNVSNKLINKRAIDKECAEVLYNLKEKFYPISDGFYGFNADTTMKGDPYYNVFDINIEYEKWSSSINQELKTKHSKCLSNFSKNDVINIFGKPSKIALIRSGSLFYYAMNFGIECPCLNCADGKYANCSSIRFYFNSKGWLVGISAA